MRSYKIHVGKRIKEIRLSRGLSQNALANLVGYPRERVTAIEGKEHLNIRTIQIIAKGLGVEPHELLKPIRRAA